MSGKGAPSDQRQRDAAIGERNRNVVVDAGAGTGKTTLLVSRLVGLVAPDDPEVQPLSLPRIAAVTFTRRAAGDLSLRIREKLLAKLADRDATPQQRDQVHRALGAVDTAHIGTIHSFADRLLRTRPREARLSPQYEITEDTELLERETYERLVHGAETGELRGMLAGVVSEDRVREAEDTVVHALDAGVRSDDLVLEWVTKFGIHGLARAMAAQRDVPCEEPTFPSFDAEPVRASIDEYLRAFSELSGDTKGMWHLRRLAWGLAPLRGETDPAVIHAQIEELFRAFVPSNGAPRKGKHFSNDDAAWNLWNRVVPDRHGRKGDLGKAIRAPTSRYFGHRLARLQPVIVALYEQVKRRYRVVDHIDLLLQLRDLLRSDKQVRGDYQDLFDHVFVDEFQDTDPLQAEIITYLCEAEPVADDWREAVLAPGKLTLVGDPKQSIYRFRRADISMYDEVRNLVRRQDARETEISVSFRSTRPLIDWLNHRFTKVMGEAPEEGGALDPERGKVYQRALEPAPSAGAEGSSVHAVSFDSPKNADPARELEAEVLPRYLRWLVNRSGFEIADPATGRPRPVRYGDIAILAVSTWDVPRLFPNLDTLGIPYTARGGTMFLSDPLHRQFLLGLRALADPTDGVAQAALLRPPFFAVDVRDLALDRAVVQELLDDGREEVARVREAREHVRELRRRRVEQSPGATARDLLDGTAFARTVAMGPNGPQRLSRLRELCLVLEQRAQERNASFDTVTAELRTWVDSPVQLDPPHPVDVEAVQIMTVHQAKGLEFPVVLLWDHRCLWDAKNEADAAWRVDRDGNGWMINLDGLTWEEPPELDLKKQEKDFRDAERKRVAYVAATRARDLLAIPFGDSNTKCISGKLLDDAPEGTVEVLDTYQAEDAVNRWWEAAEDEGPASDVSLPEVDEDDLQRQWHTVAAEAARDRYRPTSVTQLRHEPALTNPALGDEETEPPAKPREGRYGPLFGTTVHRALELWLGGHASSIEDAVKRAGTGLADHAAEARADVERATEALRREGLIDNPDVTFRFEYPVAAPTDNGQLAGGYVDLVAATPSELLVIDFKTDTPPAEGTSPPAPYRRQIAAYRDMLYPIAGDRTVRALLLFTADGSRHGSAV